MYVTVRVRSLSDDPLHNYTSDDPLHNIMRVPTCLLTLYLLVVTLYLHVMSLHFHMHVTPITYMLCGIQYMCCMKSRTTQYSSYVGTRSER